MICCCESNALLKRKESTMKNLNRPMFLLICIVIMISTSCVFAQDWPQWRGPERDGKVTRFTAPGDWPKDLTLRWKVTVGLGDSTPVLVGDKLYVFTRQGEDEVVLCLNAGTGDEIWHAKYAAQAVTGAASRHPGPRSTPVVANGKIVTLGVGGVLSCLDAASGKVVWRKDPFPKVVPRFFAAYSPIIVDGMVIAHLGGQGNGAIIAYDLASGGEKWRWSGEGPDYGSPVLLTVEGTKQIVSPAEKNVVGVRVTDGALLWEVPFAPPSRAYNASTPIIDGQTVFISGAGRGTKALKIQKQGDGFAAKELWSNGDLAVQFDTPVLRDGLLFGLTNRNNLFCINAATGATEWTDSNAFGSRGFGSIVSAGSVLAALANNSELVFYKPDGKAYNEIARYKVAESEVYAHPVISKNRVYVKDKDSLAMWVIE
jgi:outer membrane protein assembly factor BamB